MVSITSKESVSFFLLGSAGLLKPQKKKKASGHLDAEANAAAAARFFFFISELGDIFTYGVRLKALVLWAFHQMDAGAKTKGLGSIPFSVSGYLPLI